MNNITRSLTAITLAAGFSIAAIAPASADQAAATRNQIIGGLALVAGIATAINVSNKNAEAQREQGYYNDSYGYDNGGRYQNNGRTYNVNNGYNNGNSYNRDANQNGGNRRWAQRGWQR